MYAASLGGTNPEWVGRVDGIRLYDYAMTRDAVRRTMGTKERTVLVDAGQPSRRYEEMPIDQTCSARRALGRSQSLFR